MSIHKIGSDLVRPSGPNGPGGASNPSRQDEPQERRPSGAGRVRTSAPRRARVALHGAKGRPAEVEILRRISSGFYDELEVAEVIARRLYRAADFNS